MLSIWDAVKVSPPGSYELLFTLANQLFTRFMAETPSNDDYEEATALLETILDPNQPGECPDSIQDLASSLITVLAHARSTFFGDPEYTEVAISRLRTALSSPSIDESYPRRLAQSLEIQIRDRFKQYSLAESLEEADSYVSQAVRFSSSSSLETSGDLIMHQKLFGILIRLRRYSR